jgi:hypothetical protein
MNTYTRKTQWCRKTTIASTDTPPLLLLGVVSKVQTTAPQTTQNCQNSPVDFQPYSL